MSERLGIFIVVILFFLPSVSFAGYLVKSDTCVGTLSAATDFYYSNLAPAFHNSNQCDFWHKFDKVGSQWFFDEWCFPISGSDAPSLVNHRPAPAINFPFCDETATSFLASAFTIPDSTAYGSLWFYGFSLPIIIYLTAWAFASLINMFRHRG